MPIKAEIRVGNLLIEAEAENNRLMIEQLAFWSSLPEECPLCQQALSFHHRKPKNKQGVQVDYYEMLCAGNPQHRASLHQHNTPGKELYYKGHGSWAVNDYAGRDDDRGEDEDSAGAPACETCGVEMTPGQATFSRNKFGQALCFQHQPKEAPAAPSTAPSANPIDRHNQEQRKAEKEIAHEVAPPPPPKPKTADPIKHGASEAERNSVKPWIESAAEWQVIPEDRVESLREEIANPATTTDRVKEIWKECRDRIEEARSES